MKFKNIYALLLVSASFLITSCGNESTNPNALIVGTEPTFPPFEMRDSKTKEIVGFDIDLIKAIAADQGLEVEVKNLGFDALIPALQSGTINLAASGMSITDKRKKAVLFSNSYINAGISVAVNKKNKKYVAIDKLKGASAGVQIGSTGAARAKILLEQGVLSKVKTFENVALAMAELAAGGVDLVINDGPVSQAYVDKQSDVLKLLPGHLQSDSYGFALRRGNTELAQKVNAGLKNVIANGTYKKLQEKYFGK
ncbi:MAG: basic amino acid ABC transporter substrate-binding protein [Lentisphaeria bacterium]|nr:basic amino acid ABC transporter substrate-binding protein [Lentisphaeria bacterium]